MLREFRASAPARDIPLAVTPRVRTGSTTPLVHRLEDLRIVSDLVGQSEVPGAVGFSMAATTSRALRDLTARLYYDIPVRRANRYRRAGHWFWRRGNHAAALACWEHVLRWHPTDKDILAVLQNHHSPVEMRLPVREIRARYRFAYQGCFGADKLRNPAYLAHNRLQGDLWVSDFSADRVHRFDLTGVYQGTVPLAVKTPMGLVTADNGNIWICDFGNGRLVATGNQAQCLGELHVQDLADLPTARIGPTLACFRDGELFIVLRERNNEFGRVIHLREAAQPCGARPLRSPQIQMPNAIAVAGGQLYVGDHDPSLLFRYASAQNEFRPLAGLYFPPFFRNLTVTAKAMFASAGNTVMKLSHDGRLLFSANLSEVLGQPNATPAGALAVTIDGCEVLLVCDYRLGCIYRFLI